MILFIIGVIICVIQFMIECVIELVAKSEKSAEIANNVIDLAVIGIAFIVSWKIGVGILACSAIMAFIDTKTQYYEIREL